MATPPPAAPAPTAPTNIPNPPSSPLVAVSEIKVPVIQHTIHIDSAHVKELTGKDFLDLSKGIDLKEKDCTIVLFHDNERESADLASIFAFVAQKAAGPTFAACNLITNTEVAKAFTRLNSEQGVERSFALRGYPFILDYGGGRPKAIYNGERTTNQLLQWSLTLACKFNYVEPFQYSAGATLDPADRYSMAGFVEYKPVRNSSLEYREDRPIRDYRTPIVQTPAVQAEAAPQPTTVTPPLSPTGPSLTPAAQPSPTPAQPTPKTPTAPTTQPTTQPTAGTPPIPTPKTATLTPTAPKAAPKTAQAPPAPKVASTSPIASTGTPT